AFYFCMNITSYGLVSCMPDFMKTRAGVSSEVGSYLAALPFVLALLAMLVNGWHSDRTGERPWHVAVPLILYSAGIWLAVAVDSLPLLAVAVMILCVGTFMYAHLPPFWPIPSMFLGATAAASAIGFINMIGNLGGSLGSTLAGKYSVGQQSFAPALSVLA